MDATSKVRTFNEGNFENEVLKSGEPVLVDFWAPWCPPCNAIAPVIEELATEFEGDARVGKVNIDDDPGLAKKYGIGSIPTLLFIRDGEVVDRVQGAVGKQILAKKLSDLAAVRG